VNLVFGDRRSLEYRQSGVGKDGLMRLAPSPILTRHITVIGSWSAPCKAITSIVGAHPVESTAPAELPLEVINARQFDVRFRRLIVIAVLVEPGNWKWARTAIGGLVILRDLRSTILLHRNFSEERSRQPKSRSRHSSELQPNSSA
jgi:hypothetical protein